MPALPPTPLPVRATDAADPLRDEVEAVINGDIFIDLGRLARIVGAPSREAVRLRLARESLRLRVFRFGGPNAEAVVPAADVRELLGYAPDLPPAA